MSWIPDIDPKPHVDPPEWWDKSDVEEEDD